MTSDEVYNKVKIVPQESFLAKGSVGIICNLASQLPKGSTVLEIGTFYGRGACTWAFATGGKVTTVDVRNVQDFAHCFAKHLGIQDQVKAIQADSTKYVPSKTFDVVWIDGGHTYEIVKEDLKLAKFARKLICGHDYGHPNYPGVKKAVDEWGEVELHHSIWFKFLGGKK